MKSITVYKHSSIHKYSKTIEFISNKISCQDIFLQCLYAIKTISILSVVSWLIPVLTILPQSGCTGIWLPVCCVSWVDSFIYVIQGNTSSHSCIHPNHLHNPCPAKYRTSVLNANAHQWLNTMTVNHSQNQPNNDMNERHVTMGSS